MKTITVETSLKDGRGTTVSEALVFATPEEFVGWLIDNESAQAKAQAMLEAHFVYHPFNTSVRAAEERETYNRTAPADKRKAVIKPLYSITDYLLKPMGARSSITGAPSKADEKQAREWLKRIAVQRDKLSGNVPAISALVDKLASSLITLATLNLPGWTPPARPEVKVNGVTYPTPDDWFIEFAQAERLERTRRDNVARKTKEKAERDALAGLLNEEDEEAEPPEDDDETDNDD